MTEKKATVLSSEWLSTEEAMRALGKSQRTIQKLAQRKQLRWQMQPMPGKSRPERVYSLDDVERLQREAPPAVESKPPITAVTRVQQEKRTLESKYAEIDRRYDERNAEITRRYDEKINKLIELTRRTIERTPWLTLQEAAESSGLSIVYLKSMIELLKIRLFEAVRAVRGAFAAPAWRRSRDD